MSDLLDNAAVDFEHAGLRVRIVGDEDGWSANPMDNDNAGTIYSWSRDFDGDERIHEPDFSVRDEELDDWVEVDLPRYMREHYDAVLTIPLRFSDYGSSGSALHIGDAADANAALCFTQKDLDSEWNGSADDATKYATGRVNELDEWLRGEVYGVVITRPNDDEVLESCWGFIGDPFGKSGEYMLDEGRSMAEAARAELDREAAEAHRWACADVITTT